MTARDRAWFDAHLFRAHPLWIMPDWAIEADPPLRLDPAAWIAQCQAAGIQSLLFVTKHHDGRCVWPTRRDAPQIGHGYQGDFMGEICAEARRAGISIVAYYSSAIDTAQGERHPDWRFIDVDGHPSHAYGYIWVCLNSPYGEFALAQMEEILTAYEVQCLWLDIFALGRPRRDCLCQHCQAKYRARHGGDLRAIVGTPAMGRWKIDCLEEHLTRVRRLVDRHRPGALLSFNGAGPGYRRHPEAGLEARRLMKYVDFLSDEGHYPPRESSYARYLRSEGKPFEVLAGNGAGSEWVNWAVKPSAVLSLEAAVICAHGGKLGTGISVLVSGALPEGEMAELGQTGAWLAARRVYLTGQTPLSEVAILCQPYRWNVYERPYTPPETPPPAPLPEGGLRRFQPLATNVLTNGLEVALSEAHVQFDLIDEDHPLDGYRLLVLPSHSVVTADLAARIGAFVAGGGALLAEGHAGLLDEDRNRREDFLLADVLGLHFDGYAGAWEGNYLALDDAGLAAGLPAGPVAVEGPALRVRLDGAAPLARLAPPVGGERTLDRHTFHRINPPGPPSNAPAITHHHYGRGQAAYIATPLGETIAAWRNVNPWPKVLVANLVGRLLPEPLLVAEAPPGVEVLLARQGDRLLVYLFNHYLTHESRGGGRALPQIAGVTVALNTARVGRVGAAWSAPERAPLTVEQDGHWSRVAVAPFSSTAIVVVER